MIWNKLNAKSFVPLHEYLHRDVYVTHQLRIVGDALLSGRILMAPQLSLRCWLWQPDYIINIHVAGRCPAVLEPKCCYWIVSILCTLITVSKLTHPPTRVSTAHGNTRNIMKFNWSSWKIAKCWGQSWDSCSPSTLVGWHSDERWSELIITCSVRDSS